MGHADDSVARGESDTVVQVYADVDSRRHPFFFLRIPHADDRLKSVVENLFAKTAKNPKRDRTAEEEAAENPESPPQLMIFTDRHGLVSFRMTFIPVRSGVYAIQVEVIEEGIACFRAVCPAAVPYERTAPGRNRLIILRDWPGYWEIYLR